MFKICCFCHVCLSKLLFVSYVFFFILLLLHTIGYASMSCSVVVHTNQPSINILPTILLVEAKCLLSDHLTYTFMTSSGCSIFIDLMQYRLKQVGTIAVAISTPKCPNDVISNPSEWLMSVVIRSHLDNLSRSHLLFL